MDEHHDADTAAFTPLGSTTIPVEQEDRDRTRHAHRVYRARDGFEIAIPEHVVTRWQLQANGAYPNEWYALLVGRVFEDERGIHVLVVGSVPDPDAEVSPGHVQTSHESELRTRLAAELMYPEAVRVGWLHGHQNCGARFSSVDRENQTRWMKPHMLGIVIDPFDPLLLGVYRGPNAELMESIPSNPPSGAAPLPSKVPVDPDPPTPIDGHATGHGILTVLGIALTSLIIGGLVGRADTLGDEVAALRDAPRVPAVASWRAIPRVAPSIVLISSHTTVVSISLSTEPLPASHPVVRPRREAEGESRRPRGSIVSYVDDAPVTEP